jgi:hypothetical protein
VRLGAATKSGTGNIFVTLEEIDRAIRNLGDADWHKRDSAVEELAKIGWYAVEALKCTLRNGNKYARYHAAMALGEIGYAFAIGESKDSDIYLYAPPGRPT